MPKKPQPFSEEEKLAEQIHQVYCRYYKDRHGKDYWTKGDYGNLDDATKEADRYMARFVLSTIATQTAEIKRLRGVLDYAPKIPIRRIHIENYQKFLIGGKGTYRDWLAKSEIDVAYLLKDFIVDYKAWLRTACQALAKEESKS